MKRILAAGGFAIATSLPLGALAAPVLTDAARDAILTALDDEYRAAAIYTAVIDAFGVTRPFTNILKAEDRHADALIALLDRYGVPVPANPYLTGAASIGTLPDTLAGVYALGIEAELENRTLYDDRLLPVVADYPDVTRVLSSLRDASEERHLPAFERALARLDATGSGSAARGEGRRAQSARRDGSAATGAPTGAGRDTRQAGRGAGRGHGSTSMNAGAGSGHGRGKGGSDRNG